MSFCAIRFSIAFAAPAVGYMQAYEDTYEKMTYSISQSEVEKRVHPAADDDAALDMFGEEFDEKHSKDGGIVIVIYYYVHVCSAVWGVRGTRNRSEYLYQARYYKLGESLFLVTNINKTPI